MLLSTNHIAPLRRHTEQLRADCLLFLFHQAIFLCVLAWGVHRNIKLRCRVDNVWNVLRVVTMDGTDTDNIIDQLLSMPAVSIDNLQQPVTLVPTQFVISIHD